MRLIQLLLALLSCCLFGLPLTAARLNPPTDKLAIVWRSDFSPTEQVKLRNWLEVALGTANLLGDGLPDKHTRLIISSSSRGTGPVPWAHTIRNTDPEAVQFYVQSDYPADTFEKDWTAIHELSHLYLPYIGKNDSWIAEGFATYYQNVLMVRAGTLNDDEVSTRLVKGFMRGANDANQGISLFSLTKQMKQRSAFMRVYWSGTLYFMRMDIRLRQSGSSLDEIVTQFNRCCRHRYRRWNGALLVKVLDEISGKDWFTQEYNRFGRQTQSPDPGATLKEIGILFNEDQVSFNSDPLATNLRRSIFHPSLVEQ